MIVIETVKLRYFATYGEMVKERSDNFTVFLNDIFAPKHVNGVSCIEKLEM
jgi:hypothetical protein